MHFEFDNIYKLRLLFCLLVRSQLEYVAIVWASYQIKYCAMIETIQYRFFRRVSFLTKNPMCYFDHIYDYMIMLNIFKFVILESKRQYLDFLFLFKLISGRYLPGLIDRVKLHIPAKPLRNNLIFYKKVHCTFYDKFKLLNWLCLFTNEFSDRVDFFH